MRAPQTQIETPHSHLNHSDNNDADSNTRSNYVSAQPHEPQESPGREGSHQRERGGEGRERGRESEESSVRVKEDRPSEIKEFFFPMVSSLHPSIPKNNSKDWSTRAAENHISSIRPVFMRARS